jgi:hypothetical protein
MFQNHTTVCHVLNTGYGQITEVKQCRTRLVVGWVIAVKSYGLTSHLLRRHVMYVYTVAEGLAPDTGAAIYRISYGDLDKNIKH